MKLNKGSIFILFSVFIALFITSCVKYDAYPFTGKVLPRRSGYINNITNDWIYYDLRTGKIYNEHAANQDIKEGEQYNRLDWDLAFCGFAIRTNSGTSGIGKGGAADLGPRGYNKWTKVSQLPKDLVWVIDTDNVYITMSRREWEHIWAMKGKTAPPYFDPNSGPPREKTSANTCLANALRFSGPPPTYTPSFHTYVVRTADGKHYYKLQIISWFNSNVAIGDTGGRISFYCDELENDIK